MNFLKYIITLLFIGFNNISSSQPTNPILRIETGMHTSVGRRISTDASGNYLLTCSDDKTARLWDAGNGKLLNTFRIPVGETKEGKIQACSINSDGKIIALAGQTGFEWNNSYCIYLLNIQTGDIIHRIEGLPGVINDIEFSKDGKWMAAGLGNKKGVQIFDTHYWREHKKMENYNGSVFNIAFNPKGGLATVCFDGKLRLYNDSFMLVSEKSGLAGQLIISVAFNPAGNLLAVGYDDISAVEVRNATDLSLLYTPSIKESENENGGFEMLSFSNDGSRLYGGGKHYKQDKEGIWKITIRCWNNAGKGNFTDILLLKNSIIDIKPLPNGAMAVLGAYPDMAIINSGNAVNWYLSAGNIDFTSPDRSHFRISANGSSIGFTSISKQSYSFDLLNRKLTEEQSIYSSFADTVAGTTVTDWNQSLSPSINGKQILFLSKNEWCYSTDISSNGQQIILGGQFNLYMSNSKAEKLWKTPLPGAAIAVNISVNDKMVAATLSDGTIRWFNMADGKELIGFYLHDDKKRWVLFTVSGYYDASPGAEDFLGWHLNNGPVNKPSFFPVSRFREKFYRPDIIDAVFETYNETQAISLANQRSGKNQLAELNIQKLPPTISISSPANGSSVSSNLISISYSINSPADAPAQKIKVLVNGRPVATERGVKVKSIGSQKIDIAIPGEDCTITLLAENDNGTSPEANLYIKWKAPEKSKEENIIKPNLYILAIGISNYSNEKYKLGFAAKDASDFSSAILQQKGRLYKDVIIKKLTEIDASKVNILDGLQWIQEKTTRKDLAMIFFAGHGINDNNGVYYMLPVDADIERLRATCINFEEIKQTQSTIEGKVIVFIDACHSGNIMGAGGNYINGLINLLTSTVRGAGSITFTSSTGKEFSLEDQSWGNGAFTKALIEGINGAASVDEEKEITYTSLSLYISRRVKKITNDKQHPTLVPTPNTPDFTIAIMK